MVVKQGSIPDFEALRELFKHHIESFDYMADAGLETMLRHIKPIELLLMELVFVHLTWFLLWLDNPVLYPPQKERISRTMREALLPFECRQAKISYAGKITIDVCFQYNDGPIIRENINFGQFPIMLQSKLCNLRGADPQKLVSYREEASEMGGYFILNGLERVIRLLILPKRNHVSNLFALCAYIAATNEYGAEFI
ncbi:hypothetical protein JHK85_048506 [Glycine max]|nr:hypothetical protein JHK85_048506 [Glycine max]